MPTYVRRLGNSIAYYQTKIFNNNAVQETYSFDENDNDAKRGFVFAADEYPVAIAMTKPGSMYTSVAYNTAFFYLYVNDNLQARFAHINYEQFDDEFETRGLRYDYEYDITNDTISESVKKSFAGKTVYIKTEVGEGNFINCPFKVQITTSYIAYSITPYVTGSGTISFEPSSPRSGSTVTITASPDNGHFLSSLLINNGSIGYTRVGTTNQYTFVMPSSNVTINAVFTEHTLTWPADMDLTFNQNEYTVNVTKTKNAISNYYNNGQNIIYNLYKNGVNVGALSGNTISVQLTSSEVDNQIPIRFSIRASATVNNKQVIKDWPSGGEGKEFIPESLHKTVHYRINGEWIECIAYYRYNNQWIETEPYYRIGDTWQLCSKT